MAITPILSGGHIRYRSTRKWRNASLGPHLPTSRVSNHVLRHVCESPVDGWYQVLGTSFLGTKNSLCASPGTRSLIPFLRLSSSGVTLLFIAWILTSCRESAQEALIFQSLCSEPRAGATAFRLRSWPRAPSMNSNLFEAPQSVTTRRQKYCKVVRRYCGLFCITVLPPPGVQYD